MADQSAHENDRRLLHALMNIFSVQLVALLNDISVWWHCLGVLIIVGFLVFKPDHHQSFGTVFSKTINNSGFSHSWLWFVLLLGLLQAQDRKSVV